MSTYTTKTLKSRIYVNNIRNVLHTQEKTMPLHYKD